MFIISFSISILTKMKELLWQPHIYQLAASPPEAAK